MMLRLFALASAVILWFSVQAGAQDQADVSQVSLVKSSGPYEVKGESGVIGFVVASSGDNVTFKPCVGESLTLNRKQLVSTKNNCLNSPSPNENPFVANCTNLKQWDVALFADASHNDGGIGMTFTKGAGAMVVAIMADPKQAAVTVDAADQLKDCGPSFGVIGFDKHGIAKVSLIPSSQAIDVDDSK